MHDITFPPHKGSQWGRFHRNIPTRQGICRMFIALEGSVSVLIKIHNSNPQERSALENNIPQRLIRLQVQIFLQTPPIFSKPRWWVQSFYRAKMKDECYMTRIHTSPYLLRCGKLGSVSWIPSPSPFPRPVSSMQNTTAGTATWKRDCLYQHRKVYMSCTNFCFAIKVAEVVCASVN